MNKKLICILIGALLISAIAIAEMMEVEQYYLSVNPYTEVTQDLTNVRAIEIFNNGINVRVGFNDTSTSDTDVYWVIPSSAVGYERDGLLLQFLTLRLLGNDASDGDTAVVRVNVYK